MGKSRHPFKGKFCCEVGTEWWRMAAGLNGMCELQVNLGIGLFMEGNDAKGREKWLMQGRWRRTAQTSWWGGRDEWDPEHKRRRGLKKGWRLFVHRNKRRDREAGFRGVSFQYGNLRVYLVDSNCIQAWGKHCGCCAWVCGGVFWGEKM